MLFVLPEGVPVARKPRPLTRRRRRVSHRSTHRKLVTMRDRLNAFFTMLFARVFEAVETVWHGLRCPVEQDRAWERGYDDSTEGVTL